MLPPSEGGTYVVDEELVSLLRSSGGGHASSLGGLLARRVAEPLGIPAFIADPVTTDELDDVSRYTGLPEAPRVCIFHALNQKAVARRAAADLGKKLTRRSTSSWRTSAAASAWAATGAAGWWRWQTP